MVTSALTRRRHVTGAFKVSRYKVQQCSRLSYAIWQQRQGHSRLFPQITALAVGKGGWGGSEPLPTAMNNLPPPKHRLQCHKARDNGGQVSHSPLPPPPSHVTIWGIPPCYIPQGPLDTAITVMALCRWARYAKELGSVLLEPRSECPPVDSTHS